MCDRYGNNIKKWLEDEKPPEAYNLTREIVEPIGKEDAIDRYVLYQATGLKKVAKENILKDRRVFRWSGHVDRCELIEEIYGILWPETVLECCRDSRGIAGDTMNSVNTTLNHLIKTELINPKLISLDKKIEDALNNPREKWSKKKTVLQYDHDRRNNPPKNTLKKALKDYGSLECFLDAAYTIGNFIPVPKGCNRPAASLTKDYWDLTLLYIYEWYRNKKLDADKKHELIKKIFWGDRYQKRHVDSYIQWLQRFKEWDKFVNKNFLQAFVNPSDDPGHEFGRPKPLWEGHFEKGAKVYPSGEQCEEFFKNASDCIKARGGLMVRELQEKMKGVCK